MITDKIELVLSYGDTCDTGHDITVDTTLKTLSEQLNAELKVEQWLDLIEAAPMEVEQRLREKIIADYLSTLNDEEYIHD